MPTTNPTLRRLLAVAGDDEAGPTDAELDAIDAEMPVIRAEIDVLDVEISLLERPEDPQGERRRRRAHRRLLKTRIASANRPVGTEGVA